MSTPPAGNSAPMRSHCSLPPAPLLQPLATIHLCFVLQLSLFWKLQVNGLQPYVVCSDRLLSCSVRLSRFIPSVACLCQSAVPFSGWLIFRCGWRVFGVATHLLMGHLACVHLVVIANDAAANVRVCLSPCFRFFGLYT